MRVLFVGNYFLQKRRGSKPIMESVAEYLMRDFQIKTVMTSRVRNRGARMLDFMWHILTKRFDVAFIDVFSGPSFIIAQWATILLQLRGKRGHLILHGGRLPEFSEMNADRIKWLFERCDRIFTPSLFIKYHFEELGYRITYLPNPINISLFKFAPKPLIDISHLNILWVRAFSTIYNPQVAIETVAMLKKKYPHIQLTMVGPGGNELKSSESLIQSTKVQNNIKVTGPVPNESLVALYQSHDIFINTTSYESFGVAIVEAAASGIPIISTSVGEIPFIWMNRSDILLVEENAPHRFADKIEEIIQDNSSRMLLIRNARKKAEQFSWDKIKVQWKEILELSEN